MNKPEEKAILVVEDDVDVCNAILTFLVRHGYRPAGATSARDASFKLKNQRYACILLDLNLGDESGLGLIDFIRGRKDSPNIRTPLLIMSGHLDKPTILRIAGQIQGALVKPFEQSDLLTQIQKLVANS